MELAYVFGSLFHCPRKTLLGTHIPRIERQMAKLEAKGEEAYGSGYWDGESSCIVWTCCACTPSTLLSLPRLPRLPEAPEADKIHHGADAGAQLCASTSQQQQQ